MSKAIEVLKDARTVIRSAHKSNQDMNTYAEGYAYAAIGQAIELLEAEGSTIAQTFTVNIPSDLVADKLAEAVKRGVGIRRDTRDL